MRGGRWSPRFRQSWLFPRTRHPSETHPTHLAIFGAFGRLVRAQGARTQLRLYHEVSVATPDEQWFEYVDCHERTGLLRAP